MRYVSYVACAAALVTITAIGCSKQGENQSSAILAGEWKVVAMRADGYEASDYELKAMKWRIEGTEIHAFQPDEIGTMSFKLEQSQTPMEIDITALEGGNRIGETELGICSLDGERLKICLRNSDAAAKGRPMAFTTDDECWMMILDRIRR